MSTKKHSLQANKREKICSEHMKKCKSRKNVWITHGLRGIVPEGLSFSLFTILGASNVSYKRLFIFLF